MNNLLILYKSFEEVWVQEQPIYPPNFFDIWVTDLCSSIKEVWEKEQPIYPPNFFDIWCSDLCSSIKEVFTEKQDIPLSVPECISECNNKCNTKHINEDENIIYLFLLPLATLVSYLVIYVIWSFFFIDPALIDYTEPLRPGYKVYFDRSNPAPFNANDPMQHTHFSTESCWGADMGYFWDYKDIWLHIVNWLDIRYVRYFVDEGYLEAVDEFATNDHYIFIKIFPSFLENSIIFRYDFLTSVFSIYEHFM